MVVCSLFVGPRVLLPSCLSFAVQLALVMQVPVGSLLSYGSQPSRWVTPVGSRLVCPRSDSDVAVKQLQEDLRKVGEWSKKWQMPFNLDKCKIMRIGHKNKNEKYELLGKEIESVQQEKDLGVVITNDLKSSNQCIEAVKKAQKLLGYIKRQFRTRNKETILTLYNALVRPHLEYAVQFWSPSLRKDIERLEAVQARATKLIPSIRHLGYVRRLERLNLYSLEKRRLRGQLIETFKMLKGINKI